MQLTDWSRGAAAGTIALLLMIGAPAQAADNPQVTAEVMALARAQWASEIAGEAMAQQAFELVITDVLMPDGDGLDLITELRKKQPKARIIAMSGGGRYLEGSDYLKLAKGLGAHTAMMKPFTFEQLQDAIKVAFAGEREPKE